MICLQSYENFKSLIDPFWSVSILFVTLLFVLNISKLCPANVTSTYWKHFIKKKRGANGVRRLIGLYNYMGTSMGTSLSGFLSMKHFSR